MTRAKANKPTRNERSYYPIVKMQFEKLFRSKGKNTHLEVTSEKTFSNTLKSRISEYRQIIFYFLREAAPDITGFITSGASVDFVVIEVKDEVTKLDHVYQTRKYADLFDAKFSFLVTTKEIPEEIKRLSQAVTSLLSMPSIYRALTIVHIAEKVGAPLDWYPENPFETERFWP